MKVLAWVRLRAHSSVSGDAEAVPSSIGEEDWSGVKDSP